MANKPNKPSDFPMFAALVYQASATRMEYTDYLETYDDLLRLLFWNPEIDTLLAIESSQSALVHGGGHA
ncbi:hypothetical protein [Methylomonas albis]|uniref:Uncharacterized protein n=1 Tax=Methylomonas albis TaxID=1854563 RepID=A0ABR9D2Z7_9GAMM|nr:hypothetical protein [Methylomonas albis]MBD9357497.1 hypothetical protein [Methylomonas albis]CAD6880774.1 hypothetical protein [Methylomonas albis]